MTAINDFSFPADDGTYLSPVYNIANSQSFDYVLSVEFYDDEALTVPSTGVTGDITANAKPSPNGAWQNLPDSLNPSTIDASDPLLLGFTGVVYQLQMIPNSLANTNYVKVIFNFLNKDHI